MKNVKVDIYKSLVINRLLVLSVLVAFIAATVVFGVSIKSLYEKQLNTVLVLDSEGDVIPMKWMNRMENITVELKHHLDLFHRYFYEYDAFNVNKQMERALWLGDESVEQVYIKRSNDGWYNRVSMFNIGQSIEIEPGDITISGTDEPFRFSVIAKLRIKQDKQETVYLFETAGTVIFVNRNYPLNPHGMLIQNFTELRSTKIE